MALAMEDLCNIALRRIGYPTPIGFVYEGSPASRVAVEIYAQVRDNLLASDDWDFARQAVTLTLLKIAPVSGYAAGTPWTPIYPPPPWIYEYAYPPCIQVRSVRPTPLLMPEFDPQPNIFVLGLDNTLTPPATVVLTNLPNAQAVITGQANDPSTWTIGFSEAVIDMLAVRFRAALAPDGNSEKLELAEASRAEMIGVDRRG